MLDRKVTDRIDAVFAKAAASGRRRLFEHEVYDILEALGLQVPRHAVVSDPVEVDARLLAAFPGTAIVKVESSAIAHKSRLGGVRKVSTEDPLFVRYALSSMREEVLSYFAPGEAPAIEGFLIAEFIPFTPALGNEILIGAREDPAFGPVVTLSKGGDDAEFFATYYDPANILLAPVEADDISVLVHSLKIRHKYEAMGHPEYPAIIAEAVHALSRLAWQYSFIAAREPAWYLESMDINPLVFSSDGRFVAVDGFAEFSSAAEHGKMMERPPLHGLASFFRPRGIVVAGVSSDPSKYSMARNIVQLLVDMGRTDVHCLNPKGGTAIIGNKEFVLHRSLTEIPDACELLVYAAPAERMLDFLDDVPDGTAVILISGLPAGMDFAAFRQRLAAHRSRGLRFIGPNCMGVFHAPDGGQSGLDTLFIGEERLRLAWGPSSNAALLSQSGAMAITSIERNQNRPIFRSIVSFGNKADVDLSDLLHWFARDPSCALVSIYLEGLGPGEGRAFFEAVRSSGKPVIVYKAGRTEAGARAAASHTAAMSGSYELFTAACAQAGAVLVDELPDFYDLTKAFSLLHGKVVRGPRVAAVVNAGLDATMGADLLGSLVPAVLGAQTEAAIRAASTHGLVNLGASFLDVTPMTGDRMFASIVEAILADPGVDCVFVAIVPHVESLKATDENCRESDALGPLLAAAAARTDKPIVVSVNAGQHYRGIVACLEEAGLPVFSDIRSAVRSLEAFVSWTLRPTGRSTR